MQGGSSLSTNSSAASCAVSKASRIGQSSLRAWPIFLSSSHVAVSVFAYWLDHAAAELRIIDIEDAS